MGKGKDEESKLDGRRDGWMNPRYKRSSILYSLSFRPNGTEQTNDPSFTAIPDTSPWYLSAIVDRRTLPDRLLREKEIAWYLLVGP
jgi:hypothetical protein